MSAVEKNKEAIVNLWNTVMKQKDQGRVDHEAFRDHIAEDYIEHQDLGQGGGYEGWIKRVEWIIKAFPDFDIQMNMVIGEGDIVFCRYVDTGTFKGEFLGIPPTDRPYTVEVGHIFRMANGKAVEHWAFLPQLELFAQIGIIDQVVAGMKAKSQE